MITGWEVLDVDEKEEHKQHMQHAVDDSAAGYYRLDEEGIIVDVNEAWLKMFRCKNRNEIIGKPYSLARDPKQLPELDKIVDFVLSGGTVTGKPSVRKCMDGSTGKHLLSANPVIENDKIVGMEGFILDIDESQELTEHMYYAVKNSGAGYYRLDENGIIRDVNEAWLDLYKYADKEEIVGKHYSVTRNLTEIGNLEDTFNKVLNGETITGKLVVRKNKDESIGRHILSANPIFIGNKIVGMEGFVLDISHLEKEM